MINDIISYDFAFKLVSLQKLTLRGVVLCKNRIKGTYLERKGV